ncbi:hypothetical protein P9F86_02380 [Bacillus altitudinis]|nr:MULTISPECIES: hypothetical protein [Bacillus]KRV42879.1 hypothetical protein AS196_06915 [Bacillus sp. TH007]MCM3063682.1 hypothetical protein [Bacillus altitudinis]MCM3076386.1 hypothetical protein [Bacillus altitudinis]MCS3484836.1 hypothetical protein [Bacillus sp. JUb11]MDE0639240.1 hypothetical protein [Bacillus altitudinis]
MATAAPIYRNNYLNCSQLTIAAMLLRQGIQIDRIWRQAGLVYRSQDQGFVLIGSFKHFREDILHHNGIHLEEIFYTEEELDLYMNRVFKQHPERGTVSVSLDIFELPYCPFFEREHGYHTLEVLEVNDDHVVISDHAYSYHGTLSKDHLMKAARSVYEHTPRTENRYKWIKQVDLEKEPDVMKVLKEHVAILEGAPPHFELPGAITGLDAISVIQRDYIDSIKGDENGNLLDNVYFEGLKDVANSRKHMVTFLSSYENEHLQPLIQAFEDAYQSWTVLANFTARVGLSKNPRSMIERTSNRFQKTLEVETSLLTQLKEVIQNENLSTPHSS